MLTLTSPVETPLHRLPAGAKLAALALFTLVLFRLSTPLPLAGAAALVAALHLPWGRTFATHAARMLRPLWPFVLVVALWHLWTRDLNGGAVILLRMVSAVAAANLVTMTTRLSDMLAVFETLARPLSPILPPRRLALAFGLRQQGMPQRQALEAARAALAAEGRGHWAKAPVSTLSGGQKHWLCLQAVLLMAPATILLDEPFAGLDLPSIARVSRRLAALPQRLVTISHDTAAVAGADRVIWLEAGRIRADGPPAEVLPAFTAEMARIGEADADADLAG